MPNPAPRSAGKARVVVVDDHPIVRRGLSQLIDSDSGLQVCGEAEDAAEAMKVIEKTRPDVVMVDLSLAEDDGLDLIKLVKSRFPNVAVLVFSMREESYYAERALRAKASGYVAKSEGTTCVLEGIRKVLAGEIYLSPKMAGKVLRMLVPSQAGCGGSVTERLTDRELQVFEMIGAGVTTGEIARKLHLSVKTVESYRERIKDKLKLADAGELLKSAITWTHSEKSNS